MKRLVLIASLMLAVATSHAQQSVNVLFIGNSYTEVNNLPQMTADIAASRGHTLTWRSNTPGGCTFSQHCTNTSMALIAEGGWDIVVLQEQSQYPSFPQQQVEAEVFPYAAQLVEAVYAANPCAEPMFYMTWGRRDGDPYNAQSFPVLATYEGMDSMLYERYLYMAESNDASVSPVGRVWRYLRQNNPEIELYRSDGSHPSMAGTYAAACSFYVMFYGESPNSIAYAPSEVSAQQAQSIRHAVEEVVYQHMSEWKRPLPEAVLEVGEPVDGEVLLTQHSVNADSIVWDFGDGTVMVADAATDSAVYHHYADSGNYEVTLVAMRHCMTDTARATVHVTATEPAAVDAVRTPRLLISPNPATTMPTITLDGQPIDPSRADISIVTLDGRRLPSSPLSPGTYLLRIGNHTAKLVIL